MREHGAKRELRRTCNKVGVLVFFFFKKLIKLKLVNLVGGCNLTRDENEENYK